MRIVGIIQSKDKVCHVVVSLLCLSFICCEGRPAKEGTIAGQPASVAYLPAIDHVGIVVKDADKEADRLASNFGVPITNKQTMHFPRVTYKGDTLSYSAYFVFVNMGNMMIELIQPDPDVPSPYRDILDEKGEYAHHLCFLVEDIGEHIEAFAEKNPEMKIVVEAQAEAESGGKMVYVKGIIPGTLVELATLPE